MLHIVFEKNILKTRIPNIFFKKFVFVEKIRFLTKYIFWGLKITKEVNFFSFSNFI